MDKIINGFRLISINSNTSSERLKNIPIRDIKCTITHEDCLKTNPKIITYNVEVTAKEKEAMNIELVYEFDSDIKESEIQIMMPDIHGGRSENLSKLINVIVYESGILCK
ncbi:MAG: hypothetical protein PHH04_04055 [Thomasclavelia sp.]|nr:hypothetical protein [Thomasclavelia sp.]